MSPTDEFRAFFTAMTDNNREGVLAAIVPHPDAHVLWEGRPLTNEQRASSRATIGNLTLVEISPDTDVPLPGNRTLHVTPEMVDENRKLYWVVSPSGKMPTPFWMQRSPGGRWLVDASPLIASRKAADEFRKTHPDSSTRPAADSPATRPSVPALLTSSEGKVDFVADGMLQVEPAVGWAFHVARRGDAQLYVVYALTDGTPILLSDGSQTLVYDIYNNRVARYPHTRATVTIEWKPDEEKPLSVGCGLAVKADAKRLTTDGVAIRVDEFLATAKTTWKRGESSDFLFAARKEGKFEVVEIPRGQKSFRFFSGKSDGEQWVTQVTATYEQPIADSELKFPALTKLAADTSLVEVNTSGTNAVAAILASNRALAAKMALNATSDETRRMAKDALPGADWEKLPQRDRDLGSAYREALAKQASSTRPPRARRRLGREIA